MQKEEKKRDRPGCVLSAHGSLTSQHHCSLYLACVCCHWSSPSFLICIFFPSRMGRIPGVGVANSLVPVNSFLAINISFSEMLMALNPFLGCSPRRTCHPLLSYAVCPCWDRLHHSCSVWERKRGIGFCAGRNAKKKPKT